MTNPKTLSLATPLLACGLLLATPIRAEPTTADAEDPPRPPNLVVVTVAGLGTVGAPAWGFEAVLPDPEVRARVTPNLGRLAAMGCRFQHAYGGDAECARAIGLAAARVADAGYTVLLKPPAESKPIRQRAERIELKDKQGQAVRDWERLTPTLGRGRRAKDDLSPEAWERLVESQSPQRHASAAAARIASRADGDPALVVCRIASAETPRVAGVFFDRFPLDQIALPADDYDRRTLAARIGVPRDTAEEVWKEAIQAWLANASALDYAVGKVVDAVEAANRDEDSANDWAVVLAAPPTRHGVTELASRAGVLIAIPGVTEPGQTVTTPVTLDQLEATLVTIADAAKDPDDPSALVFAPQAGERYDVVATTRLAGDAAARSRRFRLVHRADGGQALYDLSRDPSGFFDLLSDATAASGGSSGMTPTRVDSVRKWLGWELLRQLGDGLDQGLGDDTNRAELAASLREAGVLNSPADYTAPMPGDFNRDGSVDAADKSLFRDSEGDEVPVGSGADANHDGLVDAEDGAIWRANYGRRAPAN